MSGESPAAVLFDVLGNTLAVYNNTALAGTVPLLPMAGVDGYNNVTRYMLTSAQGSMMMTPASNNIAVFTNGTITASGSNIYTSQYFGTQQVNVVVNVTAAPTGTTPVITFTIQEVDPGNGTTTFGSTASTSAISGTGVFTAVLTNTHSSAFKLSWTVTGTTPSFTGMYVTVTTKCTPDTQAVSGTVTATNSSVGTDGAAALGFDTQIGGKVTTAAPAYTTGNLNALSLTTAGGLRIDGVYPAATANATAADLANVGGYVTTASPTYTTGQLNPLSLTTAGALRVDGSAVTQPVSGTVTANAGTGNFNNASVGSDGAAALASDTQIGGKVTTAAPTYTTGNLNALSLTTSGLLRVDGVYPVNATTPTTDVTFVGGAVTTAAPTYTTGQLSALSLDTAGNLRVLVGNTTLAVTQSTSPWIVAGGGTAGTPATGVVTIQGISGMTPISVQANKSSTSAVTTVAGSTSNTAVLASNANRIAAAIYNNTNTNMYVLCNSGTASTSNFTILLMQGSYWEVPSDYTGAINAVWKSGVTGSVLVTEFTP